MQANMQPHMPSDAEPVQWLERIVQAKKAELARAQAAVPQATLEKAIEPREAGRFRRALEHPRAGCAVIAEVKKASPSKGVICQDFDPVRIAWGYEAAGASALSVLTDREFFRGSLEDLQQIKAAVSVPVLRKDFTLSEYHLYEAAAAGADAVLLIVAILEAGDIRRWIEKARELGMDALVEVHTREELGIAIEAGSEFIGVNNRNLKTFEVSLNTSLELIDIISDTTIAISESGLRAGEDLRRLQVAGYDGFLIGEHFMVQADPGAGLAKLINEFESEEVR